MRPLLIPISHSPARTHRPAEPETGGGTRPPSRAALARVSSEHSERRDDADTSVKFSGEQSDSRRRAHAENSQEAPQLVMGTPERVWTRHNWQTRGGQVGVESA